jgi:hypothetical protein
MLWDVVLVIVFALATTPFLVFLDEKQQIYFWDDE